MKRTKVAKRSVEFKHKPLSKLAEFPFDSKILLGIAIPLVLICALVVASNIGTLAVEKETVSSVKLSSLIYDSTDYRAQRPSPVHVQTLTLTNSLFLPKTYELPELVPCISGATSTSYDSRLSLFYVPSDEKIQTDSYVPIVYDFGLSMERNSYYSYYSYNKVKSVEVPAKGKKEVKVFVTPAGVYQLNKTPGAYSAASQLLLIDVSEKKAMDYYSAYNSRSGDYCSYLISASATSVSDGLRIDK